MGLREIDHTIMAPSSRDHGKTYHLVEMPVLRAEKWAWRALILLAASGADIGDLKPSDGMRGFGVLGLQALARGIPFAGVEPLLDEMLACIQFRAGVGTVRPLAPGDVEDISTLLELRHKIIELHVGFSEAEAPKNLTSETSA